MNTSGKPPFPGGARKTRKRPQIQGGTGDARSGKSFAPAREGRPRKPRPEGGPGPDRDEERTIPPFSGNDRPGGSPTVEQAPLLPGVKPVLELLRSEPERVDAVFLRKGRHGSEMDAIVDACRAAGVRFSLLDPPSFARVYSGSSQGVVARLFEAGFTDTDTLLEQVMDAPLPLILVLDQVQDPGNAGALARTLYALGGAGLIVPRHNGVYLGAAASKAAAGALERLPVAKAANLGQTVDAAKKLGFTVYGAASHGRDAAALPVLNAYTAKYRLPALLVLGSEESGIRPGLEKRCDFLVSIPMLRDFDSLNVAQAGGILISCFNAKETG